MPMLRRCVVLLLSCLCLPAAVSAQSAAATLPDNYAESVMILLMSDDAKEEVSLRLARFPASGKGTVWLHIAHDDGAWSLADESFNLVDNNATPVAENTATVAAIKGEQSIRFNTTQRSAGLLQGRATGSFLVAATRHAELTTAGDIPVTLDLQFTARSAGYRNMGRWELTGTVMGTVTIGNRSYSTSAEGKWHEQTGPRATFAPAFRYLNVQNQDIAMLAIQYENRFRGYAILSDGLHDLTEVSIDPPEKSPRRFRLTLDNGHTIEGVTRVVQEWSVPIEGQRRPGYSVVVDSNVGQLTGSLNDWNPRQ